MKKKITIILLLLGIAGLDLFAQHSKLSTSTQNITVVIVRQTSREVSRPCQDCPNVKLEVGLAYDQLVSDGYVANGAAFQLNIAGYRWRVKSYAGHQFFTEKTLIMCDGVFLEEQIELGNFFQAGLGFDYIMNAGALAFEPGLQANFPIDYTEFVYFDVGMTVELALRKSSKWNENKSQRKECFRLFASGAKTLGIKEESVFSGYRINAGLRFKF